MLPPKRRLTERERIHLDFLLKDLLQRGQDEAAAVQGAIRAGFLMNGGAMVAMLTFLGTTAGATLEGHQPYQVLAAMISFIAGIGAAGFAAILAHSKTWADATSIADDAQGYIGQRLHAAGSARPTGKPPRYYLIIRGGVQGISNMFVVALLLASVVAFCNGGFSAIDALMAGRKSPARAEHVQTPENTTATPSVRPAVRPSA